MNPVSVIMLKPVEVNNIFTQIKEARIFNWIDSVAVNFHSSQMNRISFDILFHFKNEANEQFSQTNTKTNKQTNQKTNKQITASPLKLSANRMFSTLVRRISQCFLRNQAINLPQAFMRL